MTLAIETTDTLRIKALQESELFALLRAQGSTDTATEALDRARLLRIADACDFLSNNLPPNSLAK